MKEVLWPAVHPKFLFLDCWKIQADLDKVRAVFPNQNSQLLIFSEGSTGHIQPLDLSLFRSWKYIYKKIEHYTHINGAEISIHGRQYFINMQVVIHNLLSAPTFKNLIRSEFINVGIIHETIEDIKKLNDICFKFHDLYYSMINCENRTLLICAWCRKHFCHYHLIQNIYIHL